MSERANRRIAHQSAGHGGGPFRRLMSPGDLGQYLKPFVFLDLFEFSGGPQGQRPLHPHSGIATVTVFARGEMDFDDAQDGAGTLGYGGVEFVRAGGGIWHGRELSPGKKQPIQGFQLWLALPPEFENAAVDTQYLEARHIPEVGPARVIVGEYLGHRSPVRAPAGITYLLVTLKAGARWTFNPNSGESVSWLAVARGGLKAGARIKQGEITLFETAETPIELEAEDGEDTIFVLGSAKPHPYPLFLGNYSVHTSKAALGAGEARIREIAQRLSAEGGDDGGGRRPVVS